MKLRAWGTRIMLGGALGVAVGSSPGCYFQEDNFVDDYAVEICRMVRQCGDDLILPGDEQPLSNSSDCEAEVRSHYQVCNDRCDYRAGKARRCLRRLRNNECHSQDPVTGESENDGDEWIPLVCSEVYSECGGDAEADQACYAPGCSVSGRGSGPAWALGSLLLWAVARRRRRRDRR